MIGVLNINKPRGVSSSFVVVKIKKMLNTKKVGHMGTLDPLAQGVLPICIGKATKLFDYFLKKKKIYIATFQFGYQTSTLDLEGEVEDKCNNIPTKQMLEEAIKKMIGKQMQLPPKYSSKKIDGKKACDLVRSGNEVALKPCQIEIFDFKLLSQVSCDTFEFEITCSAGTYIRSIARDLASLVDSLATMIKLVRTKAGIFKIDSAIDFEGLNDIDISSHILPLKDVLVEYKQICVLPQTLKNLLDGKKVFIKEIETQKENSFLLQETNQNFYKLVCEDNIIGMAYIQDDLLKVKTYF